MTRIFGRQFSTEELQEEVGEMVERITHMAIIFRNMHLSDEEYACLKVIILLNQGENMCESCNCFTSRQLYL